MLKVGDKIRITDRFSVFRGEVVTVTAKDGARRFVCTTPNRPRGEYVAYIDGEGLLWERSVKRGD